MVNYYQVQDVCLAGVKQYTHPLPASTLTTYLIQDDLYFTAFGSLQSWVITKGCASAVNLSNV